MGKDTSHFRSEEERRVILSGRELKEILDTDPDFISVSKSIYFDNYDLPCPVLVEVTKANKDKKKLVLRKNRHGDVKLETTVIMALEEFGLPVPKILAKPFQNENKEWCAVYSLLPGENLQKIASKSSEDLELAKKLLVQAVQELAKASDFISKHELLHDLPRIDLEQELENIKVKDGEWLKDPLFKSAINFLEQNTRFITTPLILSNGDYQPGNFLANDGKLSGFIDFESASFQDPMMGFVKYPIYDLIPLSRTDLIDQFLETMNFSRGEFSIRLILGCLKIIQKEIPLENDNEETQQYKTRVTTILREELEK